MIGNLLEKISLPHKNNDNAIVVQEVADLAKLQIERMFLQVDIESTIILTKKRMFHLFSSNVMLISDFIPS